MKKVVVLGSGSGSHAMAADLALCGQEVHMLVLPDWEDELEVVKKRGYILAKGAVKGNAQITNVTTDPKEALENAAFILCPLPAFAQNAYCEWIASYLEDGQVVVFTPGLLGTLIFKKILKDKGIQKHLLMGETSELPYDCRAKSGTVHVGAKVEVLCSAFPASDTDKLIGKLSEFYSFGRAQNVLQCAIHMTNPCYHAPGCVLNAGRIERSKGNFYLYEEGITPCVARVMELLDEERMLIADKVGGVMYSVVEEMAEEREPRTMWEELNGCMSMEFIKGPDSLRDRYLTEDISYGLMVWHELAYKFGVDVPLITSLLTIASPILQQNIFKDGRNADKLGIFNMNGERLLDYVQKGR